MDLLLDTCAYIWWDSSGGPSWWWGKDSGAGLATVA
jgi:hypothetical protein